MTLTQCSSCGAESPAGKRFCADCGTPLSLHCPACGATVRTGQRFCADCGTPLAAPPSAPDALTDASPSPAVVAPAIAQAVGEPVAERRMCSVLFVDLVGFTSTSELRDPEEVRELLSHYFDRARTVIGATAELSRSSSGTP